MKKNIITVFLEKILSPKKSDLSNKTSPPSTQETPHKVTSTAIDSSEHATSINLADQLYARIAQGAAFLYVFETGAESITPAGMIYSGHARENGETGYIKLSNGNPDATSAGMTGGYSIRLPDEVEAAASGRHIVVSIIARASGNEQSRFAVAYSTNGSGNSRWRWFNAGTEWSIHTMEYDVPVMNKRNGNFIGILVEGEDQPGTEFCYLAITLS